MGGNALKNTKTRRYQADEYKRAFMEIFHRLKAFVASLGPEAFRGFVMALRDEV